MSWLDGQELGVNVTGKFMTRKIRNEIGMGKDRKDICVPC